jgi:uncharacterized membrane protein
LSETTTPPRQRYQVFDIARGVAILAMVVFHVAWDLYYFGLSPVDVTTDPPWVVFQKTILTSFLLLVGGGLVLGHGSGIRWRVFWRRFAILLVAALVVTAGTYWMFPDYFVFFGVLHAIALFSLMALPALRLTGWQAALLGTAVVLVSFTFNDPIFTQRQLAWIGFWPVSPPTSDLVPILPWFGVVLIGIGGMRLLLASPVAVRLQTIQSRQPLARGIAFLGRWSLPFYVLHQPVIIGILWALMQLQSPVLTPPIAQTDQAVGFSASCQQSCEVAGGEASHCTRYCSCALDQIEAGNLWDAIDLANRTAEQQVRIDALTKLCRAMAN